MVNLYTDSRRLGESNKIRKEDGSELEVLRFDAVSEFESEARVWRPSLLYVATPL